MTKSSTCPMCGAPTQEATRPFCSRRCADIDLGRWFSGQYRVPGPPADEENAEKPEINDER
ncbi:DNA gyrase inhibitor YacG [Acetobacter farinalis]|uniref:DNA gyrase inhibitor YacG n=1 Tax=Acetobacter farinalis TaxID=1260984 RepID=A0ABT3Q746_9PROT|nr:DNA gyrase inhibitor YacG [Acetobacter farinalis]MCX2561101.1 DNA gyrase inhibitor YacG [Acetobacter farinalis]NHO29650.1 DNA gyrase inhibitor YacG [Acetobacter farinalis]